MRMGIHIVGQLAFAVMLTTVLCLVSVVSPSVANATVYYVATTGSDANPGGQLQPFRTITRGISILRPGDTLYIRGGTYNEDIWPGNGNIPSGTSWSTPITIAGYPNETARLLGLRIQGNNDGSFPSYLVFDNLTMTTEGAFISAQTHHIRVQNSDLTSTGGNVVYIGNLASYVEIIKCKVHDAPVTVFSPPDPTTTANYGFYINGNHMLIDGNTIYNNTGYAIHHFYSGHTDVSDNVIRNNVIYGNAYDDGTRGLSNGGIIATSGSNVQIYNNLIYNNGGIALAVGSYAYQLDNYQVYNNTIYNNGYIGITAGGGGLSIASLTTNVIVRNNIIYNNNNFNIANYSVTNPTIDHNLLTNPSFVNPGANDFSLQAGSPAIDAGVTVSLVTTDITEVARPQGVTYDIGAYEYYKGSTPLPAPSKLHIVSSP